MGSRRGREVPGRSLGYPLEAGKPAGQLVLDIELVGLWLTRWARIYDLSGGEEPPDDLIGTPFTTPDRLFVVDVFGPPVPAGPQISRMSDRG